MNFKTLKAIFFLQEPVGEATSANNPPSAAPGRKIEVIFSDGERVEDTTQGYSRDRLGFFMVPKTRLARLFAFLSSIPMFAMSGGCKQGGFLPLALAILFPSKRFAGRSLPQHLLNPLPGLVGQLVSILFHHALGEDRVSDH